MQEHFGSVDGDVDPIDDLGKAPEETVSDGFSVKQRKPRRVWLLYLCTAVTAITLVGFGVYASNRNSLESLQKPSVRRGVSSNENIEAGRSTADALLASAKDAWDLGDHEKVVAICDELLNEDPEQARAIYVRGASLAELEKPDLAIHEFERSIRLDSSLASRRSRSYAAAFTSSALKLVDEGKAAIDSRDLDHASELFQSAQAHSRKAVVLGSQTTERVDVLKSAQHWADRLARLPANHPFAVEVHAVREWKSRAGSYTITARFLEFDGKSVHLLKASGHTTTPAIEKLSAEDTDWLRKVHELLRPGETSE